MKPTEADNPRALLTRGGNYIAEVAIGQGIVQFEKAIGLLKANGYDGYYALEYGAPTNDSDTITQALKTIGDWLFFNDVSLL